MTLDIILQNLAPMPAPVNFFFVLPPSRAVCPLSFHQTHSSSSPSSTSSRTVPSPVYFVRRLLVPPKAWRCPISELLAPAMRKMMNMMKKTMMKIPLQYHLPAHWGGGAQPASQVHWGEAVCPLDPVVDLSAGPLSSQVMHRSLVDNGCLGLN